MNKCRYCGTEFEGEFCPECGTKYGSLVLADMDSSEVTLSSPQICRKCGTVVTGKFCSECGTQFDSSQIICKKCGAVVTGTYCSNCGTKIVPAKIIDGRKRYLRVSRSIPIMFLAYAVLLIIACCAMPLSTWWYDLPRGTTILNNNYVRGNSDMFLTVFCFVDLVVALPFSVTGILRGGKKIGKFSLYQVVGVVAILCMLVSLIGGSCICHVLRQTSFKASDRAATFTSPGAGPICVLVFSSAFILATFVELIISMKSPKKFSGYTEALSDERKKLEIKHTFKTRL